MGNRETKLIATGAYVDDVHQILKGASNTNPFVKVVTALKKLRSTHTHLYRSTRPYRRANSHQHLARKANTPFKTSAILILTMIEEGAEKLINQPTMPAMHHDHVETGTFSQSGFFAISSNNVFDLILGQSLHLHAIRPNAIARTVLAQLALALFIDHIRTRILTRVGQLNARQGTMTLNSIGNVRKST